MLSYKICPKCGKELTAVHFHRRKNRKYGLHSWCIKCEKKYDKLYYINNKDKHDGDSKQRRHDIKLQVIEHYGRVCNWPGCGIVEPAFLTGDHINNDGALHRREMGSMGRHLGPWLIKNNFPPGFQILCWNHQHLKQLECNRIKWKQDKYNVDNRKYLSDLRLLVVLYYGGRCACCGESNIDLLTIDHICGGGCKHRRKIGQGNFYRWLRDNNFPPGFQVLCHNCNDGRHINGGVCPHKEHT